MGFRSVELNLVDGFLIYAMAHKSGFHRSSPLFRLAELII